MRTSTRFSQFYAASVGLHRSMLIGATIGVAIAASRVAAFPDETASWVLLAGSALLVVIADIAREVEEAASALSESSGVSRSDARRDVYSARRTRFFGFSLTAAVALIAASLALYATDGRHQNSDPSGHKALTRPATSSSMARARNMSVTAVAPASAQPAWPLRTKL
jgi:hypothetical protein